VALVEQECAVEVKRKLQAEVMASDLAVEVAIGRLEIAHLNTKMGKLRDQVNGETSLALAEPLKFPGRLFDVVDVLDEKLGEEELVRQRLEKELGEMKAMLLKESGENDTLRTTVGWY
jgi:hypothetical protein